MSLVSKYLKTYNVIALIFWTHIFITTVRDIYVVVNPNVSAQKKFMNVYVLGVYTPGVPHSVLVCVQVFCSVLELLHSLVGLVNSRLGTVFLQSFARLVITVGICYKVPQSPGNYSFLAFTAMSLAWSISDIIRYLYYVRSSSRWLRWLRYSAFIVLYPVGLCTEPYIVFWTLPYVEGWYFYFLSVGMLIYIPGFYFLYRYMWRQRARALS